MTTGYNSQYRGSVVDAAVATVLANKNKGSNNVPVYLDATGTATPITEYSGTADRAIKDESGNVIEDTYATKSELAAKQGTLVSGINIKTINHQDVLGAGNMSTFPAQTGHAGKFLGTNGTDVSWVAVDMSSKQDVITGAATTIASANLVTDRALISNANGKVAASEVTSTELAVLDGITATTTELNKMHGVTATTSEINKLHGLTATTEELNVLDGITATTAELNYCDGVTGNLQTQLNGKTSVDLTDVSSTGKSTILNWAVPNYSAGISVASGYTVTQPSMALWFKYSGGLWWGVYFWINGIEFGCGGNTYGDRASGSSVTAYVTTGDVLTFSNGYVKVFPLKGV